MRSIKARQGEGKKVMIWGFIGLGMGQPERQVRGWGGVESHVDLGVTWDEFKKLFSCGWPFMEK